MSDRKRISSYLVYRTGDGREQIVIWDTIDIRVGRRRSQDIVVRDPEVSREHAVFRRDGDRHTVKDLGTGLGTLVNGERVSDYELQPGDVIQIGPLEMRFGRTKHAIRPSADTCYASQLKGGLVVPAASGEGGRTMLAFDPGADLAGSAPTAPPPELQVARAVSADGTLEEVDDDGPLGLSLSSSFFQMHPRVRDLDEELAPPVAAEPAAASPEIEIVLEIQRATPELEAFVSALRGKLLGVPPLRIRIKKPDAD